MKHTHNITDVNCVCIGAFVSSNNDPSYTMEHGDAFEHWRIIFFYSFSVHLSMIRFHIAWIRCVCVFLLFQSHTNIDYPNRTFTIGAKEKQILWIFYSETWVCYCPNQHQNKIEMNRIAIAGQTCRDTFVSSVGREGGAFGCVCHSHCHSIK